MQFCLKVAFRIAAFLTKLISKAEQACLEPGNYQVSKLVVHELKFEDIAVVQI